MTELTKKEEKQIAIPDAFKGFTEEESLGGMDHIQEGYLKSYKYFLSRPTTLGKFQIVNNDTQEIVWTGSEIKGAIIYYAHEVRRLKRGYVESPEKSESKFDETESEILAVTYDAQKSRGNFDSNGYGEYLSKEHENLHGKMTRLYIIMILPEKEYNTGVELVAASFSVTTIKSLNALRKSLKSYGLFPLPFVKTRIFFSQAENSDKEVYERIDFELEKDPKTGLSFVHKSADHYRDSARGVALLNKIIETHKGAVENAERDTRGERAIMVHGDDGTSARVFNEVVEGVKEKFKGTEVSKKDLPFASDDVPF